MTGSGRPDMYLVVGGGSCFSAIEGRHQVTFLVTDYEARGWFWFKETGILARLSPHTCLISICNHELSLVTDVTVIRLSHNSPRQHGADDAIRADLAYAAVAPISNIQIAAVVKGHTPGTIELS